MEEIPRGSHRERAHRGLSVLATMWAAGHSQERKRHRRAGVTLVEVLVAISLSALVLSLLFTVLEATRRVLARQHAEFRGGGVSPEDGVRLLIRDLVSATDPEDGRPPMAMEREGNDWRLRWTSAYLLPGPEPTPGFLPLDIRFKNGAVYRTEDGRTGDPRAWIPGIKRMDVEFHDGQAWIHAWPPSDRPSALPVAVRLGVQPKGDQPFTVEVALPAAERLDE